MHILTDENGNPIPHGAGHEHGHEHHHDHDHHHDHEHHEQRSAEQMAALLGYMLEHNQHHAEELDGLGAQLEQQGGADAAQLVRSAVAEFAKGNEFLEKALAIVKNG